MKANLVIGVDLGGTKILAAVLDREGRIHERLERPTVTTSQSALLDELADVVRGLPHDGVTGVGFGIPSRIDHEHGIALGAVNIPIRDVRFADEMQRRLGLPVAMENDASCAALAEHQLGAGRGVRDLVALTLGTGVGGGVISGGRLFRAYTELGHMVIVEDGEPCQGACSGHGHVESYCSGRAADKLARRLLGDGATARDLVEQHHPVLTEVGRHLGVAIGSLVNIFGSTRVVIGGGYGVAAFDQLVPAARLAARSEALPPSGELLEIERAELGADAGVIGAGLVAFEDLFPES
ncbi:MAG TPA: ROK family protein [Gaiellaceae bacterium]|nr:ROK family protein [Gaiellaceae bacterium]